jgi:hypothetical protein
MHSFHLYKMVKCKTNFSTEHNQNAFTYLVAVINVHSLQIFIRRQFRVRAIRGRFWAGTKDKTNHSVKQRQFRDVGFLGASGKGHFSSVMSVRVHRRGCLWADLRLIRDRGPFNDNLSRHMRLGYNRTTISATINEDLSTIILLTAVRDIL